MALGFTCVGIWTFVCVKALQVVMKVTRRMRVALKRMLMVIMNGDGHGSDDEDHEDESAGRGGLRMVVVSPLVLPLIEGHWLALMMVSRCWCCWSRCFLPSSLRCL